MNNILTRLLPMVSVGMLALSSCETPLDIEYLDFEPYPVVSVHAEADSPVDMRLTYTRWFLSEGEFDVVNNATARLLVNGSRSYLAEYDVAEGRYCFGSYVPHAGEKVELSVEIPDHDPLSASCVVPDKPEISRPSIDTMTVGDENYSYLATFMEVYLQDDPGEDNYYMLEVFYCYDADSGAYSYEEHWFTIDDMTLVDPMDMEAAVSGDYSESTRRFLFDDRNINGKEHRLRVEVDGYWRNGGMLKLTALTRDEYLYLRTVEKAYNSDEFLSEPVQIHSNIENGIGIFSVSNPAVVFFPPMAPPEDR